MWGFRGRKGKREVEIISVIFFFSFHWAWCISLWNLHGSAPGAWGTSLNDRATSIFGPLRENQHKCINNILQEGNESGQPHWGWKDGNIGVGCGKQEELSCSEGLTWQDHFEKEKERGPVSIQCRCLGTHLAAPWIAAPQKPELWVRSAHSVTTNLLFFPSFSSLLFATQSGGTFWQGTFIHQTAKNLKTSHLST